MASPGRPARNKTARSFRQFRRFHHVINSDRVFGTHSPFPEPDSALISSLLILISHEILFAYQRLLCADIVAKVPKSAAVDFSPKNETSDNRQSIGLQTRYRNRL